MAVMKIKLPLCLIPQTQEHSQAKFTFRFMHEQIFVFSYALPADLGNELLFAA